MPKLTHLLFLVFVIFAAHNANALNLTEGPPIPREFALAEKSDPYGRIASSYVVPDRWTNIISPLNDLKVSDGWALIYLSSILLENALLDYRLKFGGILFRLP